MQKFDWKTSLRINILTLKLVGLWPGGDETYRANFYTVWAATLVIVFNFGHNLFQMINMIYIFNNLRAVVQTTYVTLSEICALLKACLFIRNMKTIKALMMTLRSDRFQPKNQRQVSMCERSFTFWKINYGFMWTMSLGSIFFWLTYPILDKSAEEHPLPFLAWYPWPTEVSPWYEMTYMHQAFGLLTVATTAMSTDGLIAGLNVHIGAQFDLLCDNVRHLREGGPGNDFNKKLATCIEHHKEIIKFAKNVNSIAKWMVFAQFFISTVTIGITLFQVTVVPPLSSGFFSSLSFTLAMLAEIFLYCWFGNEVEVKSSNLIYAAFESDWIEVSIEAKKNMVFFLMRCQRPVKMSALNLFYLSLDTFMRVLRTAWSYFALLHQVSSR